MKVFIALATVLKLLLADVVLMIPASITFGLIGLKSYNTGKRTTNPVVLITCTGPGPGKSLPELPKAYGLPGLLVIAEERVLGAKTSRIVYGSLSFY